MLKSKVTLEIEIEYEPETGRGRLLPQITHAGGHTVILDPIEGIHMLPFKGTFAWDVMHRVCMHVPASIFMEIADLTSEDLNDAIYKFQDEAEEMERQLEEDLRREREERD